MTPPLRLIRLAPLASLGMIASCAVSLPPSAPPPRLGLPTAATTPCVLPILPEAPTQADLDIAYAERGARLVACDSGRRLAVETLLAERAIQDRWWQEPEAPRKRRWPW